MTSGARQPEVRPQVEVRRSRRRTRTVSAYHKDASTVVVLIPDRFTAAEEAQWVQKMLDRLGGRRRRGRSDADLVRRARALSAEYLHGSAQPVEVRWVDNMTTRWASCTPADRTIRVSERVRGMPAWVLDYVLLHELAHLLEPSHNERFWRWVDVHPRAERAKGYLEGVSAAASLGITGCGPEVD